MKSIICILALLCLYANLIAQDLKPLHTGEKVPDVKFKGHITGRDKSSLYQFQKKLTIINFWANNCAACIRDIPVLDSLQRANPNTLSIIMVGASKRDTKELTANTIKRISKTYHTNIDLPFIDGDSILKQYFPIQSVPQFAWLDSNFKVIAFTNSDETTAERIDSFLKGEKLSFMIKEEQLSFKDREPLFINGNGGAGTQLLMRSTLTSYIPGIPSGTYILRDSAQNISQVKMTNKTIVEMIKRAYKYFDYPARIVWPKNEESLLNDKGKKAAWKIANSYTYELILPPTSYRSAMQNMQEDLQRFFGYTAAVKPVPISCYILTVDTATLSKYKTKGGKRKDKLNDPENRYMQNVKVAVVAEFLYNNLPVPVLDESGYKELLDLNITGINLTDIASVKKQLAKFGIYLTEAERPIDHLFIYH